jgi:vesicle coat complex subunit
MARASILWLIGEYCEHVPKIAPDVLRKMAKSFTAEEDIVKLQVINLAAKLYLTNSKQVRSERHPHQLPLDPQEAPWAAFFWLSPLGLKRCIKTGS